MRIPEHIKQILHLLHSHHAEAFLVGGCVRDMLMEREVHDYDITSNALPETMMEWFHQSGYHVIPTGLRHGTITIISDHEPVEITTYRKESTYVNHRAPKDVSFSNDLKEDLKRRDFTMNAIAYDPAIGIIDPYGGCEDIQQGIIRCVGDPMERFEEDALRIMRALRFACTLHFTIESTTFQAIQEHADDLSYISKERIRDEFNKILLANHHNTLTFLRNANVLPQIIPEYCDLYDHPQKTSWHIYDIFTHSDVALNHTVGFPLTSKLAIVFHDIGKPSCERYDEKGIVHFKGHAHISAEMAKRRMKLLHYDNVTIERVYTLIEYHDYYLHPKRSMLRRYLSKFNNDTAYAFQALNIQIADDHAKHPQRFQDLISNIEACKAIMLDMEKEHDMLSLKDLCVNGHDLIKLGFKGKEIGDMLAYVYDKVLHDPSLNTKKALYEVIYKRKNTH